MRRLSLRGRGLRAVLTAALLTAAVLPGPAAAQAPRAAGVSPAAVEESLPPGGSLTVDKTVTTPAVPPRPDVVLLVDVTGSMQDAIDDVRLNLPVITDRVREAQPDSRFAVASYGDAADDPPFAVLQPLTHDLDAVKAGVDRLATGGGGDTAEDWINALWQISNGAADFRADGSPIVVLLGDASSHDPSLGRTLDDAVSSLQRIGARVLGVDVDTYSDGLDGAGQATRVVDATGGTLLAGIDAGRVADAIADGLGNLPTTVSHRVVDCDAGLDVTLDPPARTVVSGQSASFTETIRVAGDAPQGGTLRCAVQFRLGTAQPHADMPADPALRQTITIHVKDVTAPVVNVDDRTAEATGPDGARIEYPATADDAVDGPLTPVCTPPSGSLFPIGTTQVTCTATDRAGNTGTDTATITVTDGTAPLVVVDDLTAEATGPDGARIEYPATAEDTVDGVLVPECSPPSGSVFPIGTTRVTCTATDRTGNTGTDTATFTVQDTTPPAVAVDDLSAEATGPDGARIEYPAAAEDTVDGALVPECSPPSGSVFPIGTTRVTCTATDRAGNTGTDTAVFVIIDGSGPLVVVDDRTVRATGPDGARIDYSATAEDLVDGRLTPRCTPPSGSLFPVGQTQVTCTATDSAGNARTDTATFTVLPPPDEPPPDQPPPPPPPAADVAVTATVAPRPGYTGSGIRATVTVTNAGPDTATGIVLTADWPGSPGTSSLSACTPSRPCTLRAGARLQVTQTATYDTTLNDLLRVTARGTVPDPEQADNTATARVRVLEPELTVSPAVTTPGEVVLARGSHFPPGTVVTLTWSEGITAAMSPVRVAADGTFEAQMLVLRKDRLGPRELRADGPRYRPLTAPVLVVQRHLQPPDFVGRG
ncbi:hypothetical protein GCM10027168_72620 [Streptomyces capparidis]